MKKLLMVVMSLLLVTTLSYGETSTREEIRKERQEIRKMAKSELKQRVDKSIKKEAKRLAKDGWDVKPGALPLEKQLERSYLMQYEFDENLFPKYIIGEASSVGGNYDAAKVAATSLAINDLAGKIQTEVSAVIENTVANKQLSPEESVSLTESVMASKSSISQSIGRTVPVMECYRINSKKNTEVLIRIAYNAEMAKAAAKQAIREDLEKKGANLHEQLDKVLGF